MGSGKTMLVSEMAQAVLKEDAPVCIEAFDGSTFGPEDADLQVRVTSPKAIYQLASNLNEIGLARAYILGYFDIEGLDVADPYPQLRKLVELASYIRKPSPLELARMGAAVLSHGYHKVEVPQSEGPSKFERIKSGLFPHTEKADSETVSFHYDLSNEFYADFIGPSMTYTCAVFDTPDMSLDDAQRNKIDLVLDKLDLKPGDRMLDIGCGWGALVIAAAKRGIKALGVSLSHEQIEYGQEWIRREGLENLAELRVMDYREVPERDFDGITSVGMMEHVARRTTATTSMRCSSCSSRPAACSTTRSRSPRTSRTTGPERTSSSTDTSSPTATSPRPVHRVGAARRRLRGRQPGEPAAALRADAASLERQSQGQLGRRRQAGRLRAGEGVRPVSGRVRVELRAQRHPGAPVPRRQARQGGAAEGQLVPAASVVGGLSR